MARIKFEVENFDFWIKKLQEKNKNVIHKHITFEEIVESIGEIIDERDYDMKDILQDYAEYCYTDKLIPDSWKRILQRHCIP